MMASYISLCLILFSTLVGLKSVNAADTEDLIKRLPGLKTPTSFRHFSGYLEANDGKHLHYWFLESELSPATSPLVLWMNGGPGCSSVYGLLTEHGAFRVNDDAKTLSMNPYSWNKVANVIYLEAPAGVGFSYSDSRNYTTDDDDVASNNLAALRSFFEKFPEYKNNDLYITGESYGGIYVPTLSALVLNESDTFNFKGFAIGNGLHSYRLNGNSAMLYLAFRGFFSPVTFKKLIKYCCEPGTPVSCNFYEVPANETDCLSAINDAGSETLEAGINMYSIYNPCQISKQASFHYLAKQCHPLADIFQRLPYFKDSFETTNSSMTNNQTDDAVEKRKMILAENLFNDPPCVDSSAVRKWINQPIVRDALHIPKIAHDWDTCSDEVEDGYTRTYETTYDIYKTLLQSVRALIYHGDTDAMCNYMGGEWFMESLDLPVLKKYRTWSFENQTAGFLKEYQNLTFATVLGSGHMVPTDRPGQAFKLFANFLYKKPIN